MWAVLAGFETSKTPLISEEKVDRSRNREKLQRSKKKNCVNLLLYILCDHTSCPMNKNKRIYARRKYKCEMVHLRMVKRF